MIALALNRADALPLVDQIVTGIKRRIDDRQLRPGARLPSIRGFATRRS
jgi:DNA-binding transcriptional regulator YhcF (GntR family)